MLKNGIIVLTALLIINSSPLFAQQVLKLWPAGAPGKVNVSGKEADINKPTDRLVGGRKIIKLTNVSSPEIHVFLPPKEKRNGAAMVICPGGGFNLLAWDLEGTEVAKWLNGLGVTGIVVKYRTPTRDQPKKWLMPVQDTQRAISLVRQHAPEWNLNKNRIGVLGFSAGGMTAALSALSEKRAYAARDEIDNQLYIPNIVVLIYPAYLVNREGTALKEIVRVTPKSPRMFLVHAFDDPVTMQSSLKMMSALKRAGVSSELHLYDAGGHGYGLRSDKSLPIAGWPKRCEEWLRHIQWIPDE